MTALEIAHLRQTAFRLRENRQRHQQRGQLKLGQAYLAQAPQFTSVDRGAFFVRARRRSCLYEVPRQQRVTWEKTVELSRSG
jgi:hypothetical protein